MVRHHLTTYRQEDGTRVAEAWIQLNLFGRCYCFARRRISLAG